MDKKTWRQGTREAVRALFRPRGREEYRLLTAPSDAEEAARSPYPWLWLRALIVLVCLCGLCSAVDLFFNVMRPMQYVGALMTAIPMLILLYELCPPARLRLTTLICFCFVGGIISTTVFWYRLIPPGPKDLRHALLVGVFEELWKAVPAILLVCLTKRRTPAAGLLTGAAVGCGFEIIENVDHLLTAPGFLPSEQLETALSRSMSAPVSHIVWTAAICWAFCRFRRPLLHPGFWGTVLAAMTLHAAWDAECFKAIPTVISIPLPFLGTRYVWLARILCWIAALIFWFLVLRGLRRKSPFGNTSDGASPETETDRPAEGNAPDTPARLRHAAGITLCAAGLTLSVSVFGYVLSCRPVEYVVDLGRTEDVVRSLQGGRDVPYDPERPYDPALPDEEARYERGVLTYAVQHVALGPDEGLHYIYSRNEDDLVCVDAVYVYLPEDAEAGAETDEENWSRADRWELNEQPFRSSDAGDGPGVTFFLVDETIIANYYWDTLCTRGGHVYASEEDDSILPKTVPDVILAAAAAVCLIGGTGAVITLRIMARRKEKAEEGCTP